MNIKDIEKRLAEINTELDKDGADLNALENEITDLKQKRQAIIDASEKRKKMKLSIVAGSGNIIDEFGGEEDLNQRAYDVGSREYRSAYLKQLMGKQLDEAEQRALTSASNSAAAAIPTITSNKIVTALKDKYPILNAFNFSAIPDNLLIPVHSTDTGAETKAENASLTDSPDVFTNISLSGYIVDKYITVSDKVAQTSIDAFEDYLVNNLIKNVGKKIAYYIINGSGSNQPTGLEKAGAGASGAYTAGTDMITVATGVAITEKNILAFLAMVDDATAKITMSYSTFLTYFYEFMNNAKNNLVKEMNGSFYLVGHEIIFEESCSSGNAYLFVPDFFLGNFQRGITAEKGRKLAGLQNEYVAHCLFDCKPATGMGKFAKFAKTA